MRVHRLAPAFIAALLLVGGGCSGPADLSKPSIRMTDKLLTKDNTFTIASVVATADGWVVMRNQINAKASEVLAFAPVKAGENTNIVLKINRDDATAQQYVTLYKDIGKIGEFETADSKASAFITDVNEEPVLDSKGKPVEILFLAEVE